MDLLEMVKLFCQEIMHVKEDFHFILIQEAHLLDFQLQ